MFKLICKLFILSLYFNYGICYNNTEKYDSIIYNKQYIKTQVIDATFWFMYLFNN